MASTTLHCHVAVENIASVFTPPLPLSQSPDVSLDLRQKWSKAILEDYHKNIDPQISDRIRSWNLVLTRDGQVENASKQSESLLLTESGLLNKYPDHYQVPEVAIWSFEDAEKLRRTELFAVGSILYEIASSVKPFHHETGEAVQSRFAKGEFPDDVWEMPTAISILCCWCPEFAGMLHDEAKRETQRPFFDRLGQHARTNPGLFSLQVVGSVVSIASLVTLPVLGMIGFSAAGPVAGSVAAGWQGSIGLVQAGSLFAWCQSAAMGGAAVAGIIAAGASGLTAAAGATALQALQAGNSTIPAHVLKDKFQKAWTELMSERGHPKPKI